MFHRSLAAALWLAVSAVAAPPLSTIQDVLYKADGTRFNGTLTISWNNFQPANGAAIVAQGSTVVNVTNGYLQVQLVASTTAIPVATYNVTYTSSGKTLFREVWAVPATTQILQVHDVRIGSSGASGSSGSSTAADTGGVTVPLPESDVVGLVADLGARPVEGPNFAAGTVAVVDSSGLLESVSGNASDCVHVDGSSGPCGSMSLGFMDSDTLSGLVDGVNMSFGLSAVPSPAASLAVYRNGVFQKAAQDYTLSGSTVLFVAASTPQPGDTLVASYRTAAGGTSGTGTTVTSPQVLCSGSGATTNSTTLATAGTCTIASGILLAGDRVEIQFDMAHQNSAGGFSLELHWGGTTVVHRDATAAETLATGRADAAILAAGAQTSSQTWGSVLSFAVTAGTASDAYASGLTITLLGTVAQATDSLTLNNFTVVRIP
jgi:hypothetical protein